MIYTGYEALQQIAELFNVSISELKTYSANTEAGSWLPLHIDIETPTYQSEVSQYGKENTSYDEVLSIGIYVDTTSDFQESDIEWNTQMYNMFPNVQIDYGELHPTMHKTGEYWCFDTSILIEMLNTMLDFESSNCDFDFKIRLHGDLVNRLTYSSLKSIVENFIANENNQNAIKELITNLITKEN